MGYLDALTANTFSTDPEGRLVLVPFRRRRGYLVPPDRAAAFRRAQRRFWLLVFLAMPASLIIFSSLLALLLVAMLSIAGYVGALWYFTRTLEPAPAVPVVRRPEAMARVGRAMGARTTGVIAVGAAVLAFGGGWLLAIGVRTWAIWGLSAYCLLLAVLYTRQWRRLRQAAAAT